MVMGVIFMAKEFNITGTCYPEKHYMVNLDNRLVQIKQLVDDGKYFYLCGWKLSSNSRII